MSAFRNANELGKKRPVSSFRKESSADDDITLYNQRQGSIVPWSRSPFEELPKPPEPPKEEMKHSDDELKVYVSEIPWSDLLLEIAMTTAFASLTDGTPIMQGSDVASYCSFFALVWWIWASQVAYNVRFRQSDWLHRLFVFLQLLVFCTLAAFTKGFDVTNGIANDVQEQNILTQLKFQDAFSQQDIEVQNYRNNRIPTLNARGISMTIAFSRVVLLAQYVIAFFHASRTQLVRGENRRLKTTAFFVHIGSLLFSATCYFIAYLVIGKNPDETDQIVKIILWYLPLLVEVAAHFVAASVPGRVRYSPEAIYGRSSTVFIIILGGGLDKITNGFQYIVGNISLGPGTLALILCAAIIFILIFTLYFSTSEGDKAGNRRALASFFFQFFFLSSLIVTLQGIAQMLAVGSIGTAMDVPFQFVRTSSALMSSKGFGVYLNESDYSYDEFHNLNKTGIALNSLLNIINYGIDDAKDNHGSNPAVAYNYMLQADVALMSTVLYNVHANPDPDSMLYNKILVFLDTDASNFSVVSNSSFHDIAEMIITENATPALWFYAAGGMILITLALNKIVTSLPQDKYEWGQTISRLLMGSLVIVLTALDVNASSDILDANLNYEGSRIWFFATHSMVLPPYALALAVEQFIELCLLYIAGRSYELLGIRYGRSLRYGRTPTGDLENFQEVEMRKDPRSQPEYSNPFENYSEGMGQVRSSSPTTLTPSVSSYAGRTYHHHKRQSTDSDSRPLIS